MYIVCSMLPLHLTCCDVLQCGLLRSVSFTVLLTLRGGITNANAQDGGEELFIDYVLRQRKKSSRKPVDKGSQELDEEIGADSGSDYEYDGPRNETYDPHNGFEMYWPNGEWVLPEYYYPTSTGTGSTTFNTAEFCGRPCPQKYKDYGPVCAKNLFGVTPFDFNNYCEFMNQDCERTNGWHVAYRGRCDRNPVVNQYDRKLERDFEATGWRVDNANKADALMMNFFKSSPMPRRDTTTTRKVGEVQIKD